jgi:acyl-CoA synthetase (AMP-forming)/AMP-acid ligase II
MRPDPLVEAFRRTAARTPDAVLVATPSRRATAGTIAALADALADGTAAAFRPGTIVGLSAPNGPAFLSGLVALLAAGVRPALLDAGSPEAERDATLRALGAAGCLSATSAWPDSPASFAWTVEAGGAELPGPSAAVKVSSGTTARPRGIVAPVEGLLADVDAIHRGMGFRPDERYLSTVPLSHSYGLASLALPALVHGATLVIADARGPFEGLRAARELGATVLPTVPAWIQALLRVAAPPPLPETVHTVLTAGAPLPPDTAARFREAYGRGVHVFYGASECGGICYDPEGTAGERGTVGPPLPGVEVRIVAAEDGDDAARLVEVRSRSVCSGYWPEPDPRLGDGAFRTGDLAEWSGDEVRLVGRADDLINVRGRKVHPAEIERVLGQLPGVEEVVALGGPAPERADPVLRVVVACPSRRLSREDVVAWCRAQLADHKVPRSVVLVDALPRNERGKVDRAVLRAL